MKEKIKKILPILLIILIVLGIAFYWYEWRPMQIRKHCAFKAYNKRVGFLSLGQNLSTPQTEQLYKDCLRENGLEK